MRWIKGILGTLFGGGRNVVAETAEVFRPNAEAADQRSADAQSAALRQMAAEFGAGSGWFHQIVNGFNRLPRPLMAFGVIGLFGAAMFAPEWFAARMQGLALVPEPLWWLMGAIVSFYFGERELHKLRSGRMAEEAARITAQAPQVASNIEHLQAVGSRTPRVADAGTDAEIEKRATTPDRNPALDDWRHKTGRSDR